MLSKCLFETENFHMFTVHSFIHTCIKTPLISFHVPKQAALRFSVHSIAVAKNMHQIKTLSEVLCHNCLLQYIHLFAEMILQAHHVIYKGKP